MEKNDIKILFTLGEGAKLLSNNGPLNSLPRLHLTKNIISNQSLIQQIFAEAYQNYVRPNSLTLPKIDFKKSNQFIPRKDLPYQTRWWMGTAGNLVQQAKEKIVKKVENHRVVRYEVGKPNGDYYKLYSPAWSNSSRLTTQRLNEEELLSVKIFENTWHDE